MVLSGKGMLVVDDEPALTEVIGHCFGRRGVNVVCANNLEQAREAISGNFDIALVDQIFPGEDRGVDFFRDVLAPRQIPTLLVTSHADVELTRTFLRLGGSDIIQKPFTVMQIEDAVEGVIKGKRASTIIHTEMHLTVQTGLSRVPIKSPADAFNLVKYIGYFDREVIIVIPLDINGLAITTEIAAMGTIKGVETHQRDIFRLALSRGATSVYIAHNHPSGKLDPSMEDIELTRAIEEAGHTIGIPLVGHIIVAHDYYLDIF